jgi:hypothetical protein
MGIRYANLDPILEELAKEGRTQIDGKIVSLIHSGRKTPRPYLTQCKSKLHTEPIARKETIQDN